MQDDSSKDNNVITIQPPNSENIPDQKMQENNVGSVQSQPVQGEHNEVINNDYKPVAPTPVIEHTFEQVVDPDPVPTNNVVENNQPQPNVLPSDASITINEVKPPVTNSPGLIVLQWLTYAFWGCTVIAMSVLTVLTLTHFLVSNSDVGDAPLYSIAAILVLLPISIICDVFYMKYEPEKKTGASSIVMIIHAVIFALFGIGALVTVVFSLVTLFVNSSNLESTLVALYSALIIAFLYALIFLRTILPSKIFHMRRYFIVIMAVIVGIFITLSIVGPVVKSISARNDKLIESSLSDVSRGVNSYAHNNKKLPSSLDDVTLTGDAKKLVSDNLVEYKNEGQSSEQNNDSYYATAKTATQKSYHYQLCVTYAKATNSGYSGNNFDSYDTNSSNDYYNASPSTYSHPAGNVCYKIFVYI